MSLKATLSLQQKPMLVMTPKLQQAIKVLLMSRLELTQHLSLELQQNPILEEDLEEELNIEDIEELDVDPELNLPETDLNKEDKEPDIDWDDFLDDTLSRSERDAWEYHDDADSPREDFAGQHSLQAHLLFQLRMSLEVSEKEYRIGEEIIDNIDDNGYLKITTEEIASELNVGIPDVEDMLEFIQTDFEPTGVGARDIRECLLIQIWAIGMEDSLAAKVITNHFDDFTNNRIPKIAKSLGVSVEDIQACKEDIKDLEPYPGRQFGISKPDRIIIPDVTVGKVDGEYKVISNDDGMPKLRLSKHYLNMLRSDNDNMPSDAKEYLEGVKRKAIDLLKSITQRRQTIVNVTESIFEVQRDFLEQGVKGLKPLVLKDIADMAGVHESTVSRVTTNKYVQTPQGIYELKEFFSGGLKNESGGETSTSIVKEMLKDMVENEDLAKPLSDQQLSEMLKEKGISVARRTIAKYRDELGILPSSKRREKW